MCFDYDYHPEFQETAYVKTRKPHLCEGCFKEIPAGQLAEHTSGKFDGDFFAVYLCGACCHTIYRIHLHELEEGCSQRSSWIAAADLLDYCKESPFGMSSVDEGQAYLSERKTAAAKTKACSAPVAERGKG